MNYLSLYCYDYKYCIFISININDRNVIFMGDFFLSDERWRIVKIITNIFKIILLVKMIATKLMLSNHIFFITFFVIKKALH